MILDKLTHQQDADNFVLVDEEYLRWVRASAVTVVVSPARGFPDASTTAGHIALTRNDRKMLIKDLING
jgi:hypothetical protein